MSAHLVVAVDDDPEMLELLSTVLMKSGYRFAGYGTPGRFLDAMIRTKPALCVIDVQLPGMDGRELIRVLRASPETSAIPLIAISAVAREPRDVISGLDTGASEYFPKPLDLELLVARVANLIARSRPGAAPPAERLRWKTLEIAPDEHRVTLSGQEIALTNLEFQLLLSFLRQPNRVLARSWLLQTVWKSDHTVATRTVDKHVETLRRKVPPFGKCVEAVVGVGYLFRP